MDPADLNSLRAAKYNQYQSSRNVQAISRLLGKAKLPRPARRGLVRAD
ncbi:hypothetical protein [Saccharothrix sp. NRRL B-16348]|nr:hypothetical protein [Saccharothrix sp. NRRL B-16348]